MGRHKTFDAEAALLKAVEVFWEKGYAASAITDLCRAMDLNPGSVYATYGQKDQLFLSAVRAYLQKVTTEGIDRINAAEDGIAGIRSYFHYIVEGILTGQRRFGCLGTNSLMELGRNNDEVRAIMLEHLDLLEQAFRNALERAEGDNPQGRATYLLCMAQGINVLALTQPDRATLTELVHTTFQALPEHK